MIYLVIAIVILVIGGFTMFYLRGKSEAKQEQLESRLVSTKEKKKIEEEIGKKDTDEKIDLADNLWDE